MVTGDLIHRLSPRLTTFGEHWPGYDRTLKEESRGKKLLGRQTPHLLDKQTAAEGTCEGWTQDGRISVSRRILERNLHAIIMLSWIIMLGISWLATPWDILSRPRFGWLPLNFSETSLVRTILGLWESQSAEFRGATVGITYSIY